MNETFEILKLLSPLGVGGILAGVVFYFYRRDVLNGSKALANSRDLLMENVIKNTEAITEFRLAVKENTEILKSIKDFYLARRD
jgi:hypothetical protein